MEAEIKVVVQLVVVVDKMDLPFLVVRLEFQVEIQMATVPMVEIEEMRMVLEAAAAVAVMLVEQVEVLLQDVIVVAAVVVEVLVFLQELQQL